MSFCQPFLRGHVSLIRVAPVCGMIVVLPLLGCGSVGAVYETSGRAPERALQSRAAAASKDIAVDSFANTPTSGTFVPGKVEKTALAPVPAPAPASEPEQQAAAVPPSGGFALASMQYGAPQYGAPKDQSRLAPEDEAPTRVAGNYGRRPAPSYVPDENDYQDAGRPPRGEYAPPQRYQRDDHPRDDRARDDHQGGGDYVVQSGDTLYAIAERYGVSIDELSSMNALQGADIYPGQRLRIDAGKSQGYGGRPPYREAVPGPRGGYPDQAEDRAPPYQGRQADRRGDDRGPPPSANVYQPRYEDPRAQRYDQQPDRYQPRPPYRESYQDERRQSPREQAYDDPRRYQDRQGPDYTSSNNRFTPDGPFQPSPDAPWRGEAEWRHMSPQAGQRPDPEEPQFDIAPRSERRRGSENTQSYDDRSPYQAERQAPARAPEPYARRAPYSGPRSSSNDSGNRNDAGNRNGSYNYTVVRGDTLHELARRNGIDMGELADMNGLPRDAKLQIGQSLRIPRGEGYDWSRPRPEASNQPAPPASRSHAAAEPSRPAPVKGARQASPAAPAAPEGPKAQPPLRLAKAAVQPAQRRAPEPQPAPEVVEDTATRSAAPVQEMPATRVAVAAPADTASDVAMNDPAATTASAHAVADRTATRECEAALASPEARSAKTFRMPVQGMVVAKFGAQNDGSFNDGINFSVPKGTPVKAAENGVVAYAGDELAGFGNLILIRHADGFVTAYANNDELLVRKCDAVKRGQIISKAGTSGKATSPQLHFELRKELKTNGSGRAFFRNMRRLFANQTAAAFRSRLFCAGSFVRVRCGRADWRTRSGHSGSAD